ncbi:MAG: T9SS type A sorting domain-containing protein [Bacteroidetes bacterium]|nr:T9SS type A sorting domain-containing protein [Bacteroidota bacterium]
MKQLYALAIFTLLTRSAMGQWTQFEAPANAGNLWCIEFSPQGPIYSPIGYIGCDQGLLKSFDGTVWFDEGARSYAVYGLAFNPPAHGSAACAGGRLLVTLSSGTTWVESNTGSIPWVDFQAVCRPNVSDAFAVGSFGALSSSANAGNSWATQFMNGFDGTFHQVQYFNASTGVVVGDGGLILRTEAGEWEQAQSGTNADLIDMHFPSSTVGYTVGEGGVVLKSMDAGVTWQALASPTTNDLSAVYFENELAGYIAGRGATLWYTLDGGVTWEPDNVMTSLPDVTINALKIHDDWYYAVGNDGLILRHGVLVGIEEHGAVRERLFLSPNPATDRITIVVPGERSGQAQLTIFDPAGKCLRTTQAYWDGQGLVADIRSLPAGLFFCEVRSGNGFAIGRFIKE